MLRAVAYRCVYPPVVATVEVMWRGACLASDLHRCESGDVPLEQQERFRALLALGRIMALAVFHEQPLPISFSPILCKHLLRVPVGMGDVRRLLRARRGGLSGKVGSEAEAEEQIEGLGGRSATSPSPCALHALFDVKGLISDSLWGF